MEVKVICQCGVKFAFDIEPVNGRMPCAILCPSCGADATDAANAVIAEKLAPAPPPPAPAPGPFVKPMPLRVGSAAAPAQPVQVASAAAEESAIPHCPKHLEEIAVAECFVCQKPICTKCMEQFGYLCSSYCKGQAEARKLKVPVYGGQKKERIKRESVGQSFILTGSVVVVALLLGAYIYYWFVASHPHIKFKVETGPGSPFLNAAWVGEDRFIGITPSRLTMYKADDGSELWSANLPANEIKGHKGSRDQMIFPVQPLVKVISKDIWIGLPHHVLRLDGETGKQKQDIPLSAPAAEFRASEEAFLAVSGNRTNDSKLMTRISLANGGVEMDATPITSGARRVAGITRALPGLQNTSLKNVDPKDEDADDYYSTEYKLDPDYVFTGANVAHITRRVLEERVEVHSSTKPQKGPLIIDSQSARASQGLAAAQEFMNQGQPDTKVDLSLYSVTIRRYFGGGSEWTGQVTGRPYFFSQKTVDCLVAGNTLIVFNKNNQKIWEAKLTYGISPRYADDEEEQGPALEVGNRLLFYDQGVLSCFDLKKGEAQWRVNSVGISGVVPDNQGNIYVSSTTAEPEAIRYDKQITFSNMVYPMIVKVQVGNGKVLWQSARVGTDAMVSNGIIYTTFSQISGAERISAAAGGEEAPTHWRIFRLDPDSGKDLWEFHRIGVPHEVLPKGKRVILNTGERLLFLKYM